MDRKEQLMKIFSVHIREILTALPVHIGRLQEIRLRAGRPLMILYDNKEYLAGQSNIVTESSGSLSCFGPGNSRDNDVSQSLFHLCL